jgi:hypothetical protein
MNDLELRVERTIDDVIRFFNSSDPQSYNRWDGELERLAEILAESEVATELLIGSVLAQRIYLALEIGKHDRVVALSTVFLRSIGTEHPSWYLVLKQRFEALHVEGLHNEELTEALAAVKRPEIRESGFLHLLADLSRRHPGSLAGDMELADKTVTAVSDLRARGYESLRQPSGHSEQLEEELREIVSEVNKINKARGNAVLAGEQS